MPRRRITPEYNPFVHATVSNGKVTSKGKRLPEKTRTPSWMIPTEEGSRTNPIDLMSGAPSDPTPGPSRTCPSPPSRTLLSGSVSPPPQEALTPIRPRSNPPPDHSETRRTEVAYLLAQSLLACDCTICTRARGPRISPSLQNHLTVMAALHAPTEALKEPSPVQEEPRVANPFPWYSCPHLTRQQQIDMVCYPCTSVSPHCMRGHLLPLGTINPRYCTLCVAMDEWVPTKFPMGPPRRGRPPTRK